MADNVEIQGLEFRITNDSKSATQGIRNLQKAVSDLKTATSGTGTGLKETADGISNLATASNNLGADAGAKISSLASALSKLGKIGTFNDSFSAPLEKIQQAISSIDAGSASSKISSLVSSLQPLTTLSTLDLGDFVGQLTRIPTAIQGLQDADLATFLAQVQELTTAMQPLAAEMQSIANGFSALPNNIQRVIRDTEQYNQAIARSTTRTNSFSAALNRVVALFSLRSIARFLSNAVTSAAEYTENLNLFAVTMGEYGEAAYNYAQKVSEVMGIDPSQWLRNQGVFNTIIEGFGVSAEKAALMSQNLTQLGYDIASFYNLDFDKAMQKVQSGISGELEPMRRLGYDLSVARLEQERLNLGIEKSVADMTQAEKSQLRYYAMMTQVTQVQGDMARTLENPANQLRILKSQVELAARAIGSLFIPVLNAVLPVLIAVANAVQEVVAAIASLFGITMNGVDWGDSFSSASTASSGISEDLDSAAGSAKELTKYLGGFDELNVMSDPNSGGSGSGASAGGGGFDIDLPEYDFLSGAVSDRIDEWKKKIEPTVTWVKDHLEEIATLAEKIAAAFLAWKISSGLISTISGIANMLKSSQGWATSIALGGILSFTGFSIEFDGLKSAIEEGLNGFNFSEILVGGLVGTAGAGLFAKGIAQFITTAFGSSKVAAAITAAGGSTAIGLVAASIAGLVAGIPMIVVGITDSINNGINTLSALLTAAGTTISGAAIGAIVGMLGGPLTTGIGALIGLVTGALIDLGLLISEHWDEISDFLVDAFDKVSGWVSDHIIEPVKEVLNPVTEWISTFVDGCWLIVQAVWLTVSTWFDTNVIQPVAALFTNIKTKIVECFTSAWTAIKLKCAPFVTFIKTKVVEPIKTAFTSAWDGIKSTFQIMINGLETLAKSLFNKLMFIIENAINYYIGGINTLISGFNKIVSWAGDKLGKEWSGLGELTYISLPRLANGGFVDEGQLFIARESGAEMVGSIGNQTAVANNDQIVEAIRAGVYEAVTAAMNGKNEGQVVKVYLDGKEITAGQNRRNRMYGAALVGV